jgi:phosphomannomutase
MLNRIRKKPPKQLDGAKLEVDDLLVATPGLPATDGLRFRLADGRRVIIRPSGTEPKLKCYLQAKADSAANADAALAKLAEAVKALLV